MMSPTPREASAEAIAPPWVSLATMLDTDPGNMRLRAELFDQTLAAGAFDAAAEALRFALAADPSDAAWQSRLAALSMARGEWQDAVAVLQALVDRGDAPPDVRYNLAYAHFALGRFGTANAILGALMEEEPSPGVAPEALALRLRCLHRERRLEEGMALYQRHEALEGTASAAGAAALLALDAHRFDRADAWAAQALGQHPLQHEALVARGSVLIWQRRAHEALELLQQAAQRHPDDGRTLSAIGAAHLLASDFPSAHAALDRAVRAMPDHIGSWHALGWCRLFLRDLEAAQHAFERALALDRNVGDSHGGLAVTLALRGEVVLAREALRRAEGLPGANLAARYAASILDGEAQDPARFEQMARRILGLQRDAEGRSLADVLMRR